MNFDFKITTWERVNVSKEQEAIVLEAIKSGEITSSSDIYDFLADKGDVNVESETLLETDEQMTIEENGGSSTIEVMDEGKVIYQNGE